MFIYEKKLQFPVKIATPNPKLASFIISQYGGPDGELGASMRYLSQRYAMPYDEARGLLTDIGTEGMKCNLLMLNKNTLCTCFDAQGVHKRSSMKCVCHGNVWDTIFQKGFS